MKNYMKGYEVNSFSGFYVNDSYKGLNAIQVENLLFFNLAA